MCLLYTGSDLSAWLESNPPATSQCPVCKSQIKDIQEDVIPIYSGGGTSGKKQIDPRTKPRPKPRVQPAPTSTTTTGGSLGWLNNGGLFGPFWDLSGPGTAMGISGLPIYPGMTLGWSSGPRPVHLAGPRGMTVGYAGVPQPGAPLSPEQQELARRQQRNALIAFIVMIVIFSIRKSCSIPEFYYTISRKQDHSANLSFNSPNSRHLR